MCAAAAALCQRPEINRRVINLFPAILFFSSCEPASTAEMAPPRSHFESPPSFLPFISLVFRACLSELQCGGVVFFLVFFCACARLFVQTHAPSLASPFSITDMEMSPDICAPSDILRGIYWNDETNPGSNYLQTHNRKHQ